MEKEMKLALGKILGETYRTQKRVNPELCPVADHTIFGLINGFEHVVDEQLFTIDSITLDEINAVADVLTPYHNDNQKRDEFTGYYTVEHDLEARGISRWKAIHILTYMKANGQFVDLINRMDSQNSPGECRRFDIDENNA